MEKETVSVEQFYQDVADVLGVESNYEYNRLTNGGRYLTRWNNRKPGNGRFEGFGTVRYFGPHLIHVAINRPVTMIQTFTSIQDVLEALKKAVDASKASL